VAEQVKVGEPFDESTQLGPLVSEVQRDRVRSYIAKGVQEGATLLTGGAEPPEGLERGYYVRPTVFSGVTPEMTFAREEIFGPVLAILASARDAAAGIRPACLPPPEAGSLCRGPAPVHEPVRGRCVPAAPGGEVEK